MSILVCFKTKNKITLSFIYKKSNTSLSFHISEVPLKHTFLCVYGFQLKELILSTKYLCVHRHIMVVHVRFKPISSRIIRFTKTY